MLWYDRDWHIIRISGHKQVIKKQNYWWDITLTKPIENKKGLLNLKAFSIYDVKQNYFFLCRFLRSRFLRLCLAIFDRFLFFPLGIIITSIFYSLMPLASGIITVKQDTDILTLKPKKLVPNKRLFYPSSSSITDSFTASLKSLDIFSTGTYCSGTITSSFVLGFRATR